MPLPPRDYHSPLREAQAEATRQRILDAAIDLLVEQGPQALGQRAIARRAAVSAPTVARYLPDAESVLAGIDERLAERMGLDATPTSPEQLLGQTRAMYLALDGEERAVRAWLAAPTDHESLHQRRRQLFERAFDGALGNLSADDRRCVMAVLHMLLSARTWLHLREVWGIRGEDAALTADWAIRALYEAALRQPPSEELPPADPRGSAA
jgi:AcrR family transcriptional regulator